MKSLNNQGRQVKYIRCDNAGENLKFKENADADENLELTFEFTAPGTPQQNGKIERKFATLFGRTIGMLNGAKLTKTKRRMLWAEVASTAIIIITQ